MVHLILETCDRITQIVKMSMNDLRKKQVSGFYRDIDLNLMKDDEQTYKKRKIK